MNNKTNDKTNNNEKWEWAVVPPPVWARWLLAGIAVLIAITDGGVAW
jgi:hypothetical protein